MNITTDWITLGGILAIFSFLWVLHRDMADLLERMARLEGLFEGFIGKARQSKVQCSVAFTCWIKIAILRARLYRSWPAPACASAYDRAPGLKPVAARKAARNKVSADKAGIRVSNLVKRS